MKNLLKIGFTAVLLFVSACLYAGENDFSFKAEGVNKKSVVFFVNEAQIMEVSIYGAGNEVLYKKKINAKAGSTKTYDLNSFPDGNYRFKVVAQSRTAEYNVLIEDGDVQVSEPSITEAFNPAVTIEDGLVMLNLKNAPKGSIEVQVLNKYNEELYKKVYDDDSKCIKRFKIAGVGASALTFVIRTEDAEFEKTVQLN
ncbi:hypothetical protein [Pedobacter nyackensis]|uniref:Por secretion system C-terminal sorting domain-containing protein n=1 Tax=Pedobacter nyackensis TaxID=475255 RepID=A0A1W2EUE0_9SPHI|nr:hypothetical protein [Pedobacter nyackensis]SMD13327.1 hypothetical protein SAMN04488101_11667 [Pedobacter nyackensis]